MNKTQNRPLSQDVHISSFIVQARPEYVSALVDIISQYPDAEVPMFGEEGKLVVALETKTMQQVTDRVDVISRLDGVINTVLVYHQVEAAHKLDEMIEIDVEDSKFYEISETSS